MSVMDSRVDREREIREHYMKLYLDRLREERTKLSRQIENLADQIKGIERAIDIVETMK